MLRRPSRTMLCVLLAMPLAGCRDHHSGADAAPVAPLEDPLATLRAIDPEIRAELDRALQPVRDAELVLDQLDSLPRTLGVDEAALRRLAAASVAGQPLPSVQLEASAETRAEVTAVLDTLRETAESLRQAPRRIEAATKAIDALAQRGSTLADQLVPRYRTALARQGLEPVEKMRLQAELDLVDALRTDIEQSAAMATTAMQELPTQSKEALAQLDAAFAAG